MYVTEQTLRQILKQPRYGMTVRLPSDARLSPAAAEFVAAWGIEVSREPRSQEWNTAASFPVRFSSKTARASKQEHETQLNAERFVSKNAPRIKLRGKLDTLHALCLLCGSVAKQSGQRKLVPLIETLAAYVRELLSAEYNEREPAELTIDGHNEAELRDATHDPERVLGTPHVVPSAYTSPLMLQLNYLRCTAREAEIYAVDAYLAEPQSQRMLTAMNRFSSAVYYLELLYQAGTA